MKTEVISTRIREAIAKAKSSRILHVTKKILKFIVTEWLLKGLLPSLIAGYVLLILLDRIGNNPTEKLWMPFLKASTLVVCGSPTVWVGPVPKEKSGGTVWQMDRAIWMIKGFDNKLAIFNQHPAPVRFNDYGDSTDYYLVPHTDNDPEKSGWAYIGFDDLQAVNQIYASLSILNYSRLEYFLQIFRKEVREIPAPNLSVVSDDEIQWDHFKAMHNLVLIASGRANEITIETIASWESMASTKLGHDWRLPYKIDTTEPYNEGILNEKDSLVIDLKKESALRDCGIILLGPNPFDPNLEKRILILQGNGGPGTYACARFVTEFKKKLTNFVKHAECGNGITIAVIKVFRNGRIELHEEPRFLISFED